ncbi:hypothetical protein BD779DRAFT_519348 [Infundibulicybe gibba]|nr:hypothetical protein BD779DRAFT_519348 [Infundibulicybe gibba]
MHARKYWMSHANHSEHLFERRSAVGSVIRRLERADLLCDRESPGHAIEHPPLIELDGHLNPHPSSSDKRSVRSCIAAWTRIASLGIVRRGRAVVASDLVHLTSSCDNWLTSACFGGCDAEQTHTYWSFGQSIFGHWIPFPEPLPSDGRMTESPTVQ